MKFLESSVGDGSYALRVKAFAALIVPLLGMFGITLISEEVDKFIDAAFVLAFGILQVIGWARRNWFKENSMGAFKK